jgi:hypothetical protein
MATLRDLGTEPFETAPADDPPRAAPTDRWMVLVDSNGEPVSALAPGTAVADGGPLPGILFADADMEQAAAFESDAFQELTDVSALVLTGPSPQPGQPSIAGLVSGEMLIRAVRRGAVRGPLESLLPGAPSIPLISRSCRFTAGDATCATTMPFPALPYPMPDCHNDHGLAPHQFVW